MAGPHIPGDLTMVDAAWLSAVLGAEIVEVVPGGPTGGIPMTSRVARFRLVSRPAGAAPRAVVVKLANPRWTSGSEPHEREVSFYRDFAGDRELPVPRCYHADFDASTGAFALVLEDLGDLVPGHRLEGTCLDETAAVVDGLAALHRAWWHDARLRELKVRGHDADRIAQSVAAFDARWSALEACGKYSIGDELRASAPRIRDRYADGMLAISSRPQTLIHSDLHVENFFLAATPGGGFRLFIIDWQNPCFGHCAFDVSQVLTSMQPQLVAEHRDRLVARYHERLDPPGYTLDQLQTDVAASLRHQLVGGLHWLATFEPETARDASLLQGHWERLCAALLASEMT